LLDEVTSLPKSKAGRYRPSPLYSDMPKKTTIYFTTRKWNKFLIDLKTQDFSTIFLLPPSFSDTENSDLMQN
jgi:hypothetical protein